MKTFIGAIIFLLILFLTAFAQNGDKDIEEIVVTASRWEELTEEVPDRITTITKEDIAELPIHDAAEALDYVPGLIMDRTGGPGSFVFPSVQGSEFYQTTVLINGIPLNDLSNGIGNLSQIPAEQIERIEVIHGAGGTEWGSALGGVINVITHKPRKGAKNSVIVGGGDYASGFSAANLQFSSEVYALAVGGGYRSGEGPEGEKRKNNSKNLVANTDIDIGGDAFLSLLGYTFQGEAGSGAFRSSLEGYWENYKYRTSGGGGSILSNLGPGEVKATGYYQTQTQNTLKYMESSGLQNDVRLEDKIYGGSVLWRAVLNKTAVTMGVEGKSGELKSTVLFEDKYRITTSGEFVNLQQKIGSLVFQGGVRHSEEDYFGSFTGFNAGAVYVRQGLPAEFRISISSGYTTPPLAYRYLEISEYFAPNPDLKVEKATSYQAGIKTFPVYGITLDLNGFWSDVTDAVSTDINEDGLTYYRNFEKFRRRGIEAGVKLNSGGIALFANTLQQEIRDMIENEIVKNKVRSSYSAGIGYKEGRFSSMFSGTWKDWNAEDSSTVKDRKWLFSAKASYKLPFHKRSLNLTILIYNITNVELATNEYLPLTHPRHVEASIKYLF